MNQTFIVPALLILAMSFVLLTGFCVYSYRSLKHQLDQVFLEGIKITSLSESLVQTAKQLDKFCPSVSEPERRGNPQSDVAMAQNPVKSNVRGQVMRLHRSGESVSSIASALGVSQGEVKLMVKVQELLSENGSGEHPSNFI